MVHWYVGQKVVCISDAWTDFPGEEHSAPPFPVEGEIYHIADIIVDEDGEWLDLQEFKDAIWDSVSFEPLRDTDISLFTKLLQPTPTKIKETV